MKRTLSSFLLLLLLAAVAAPVAFAQGLTSPVATTPAAPPAGFRGDFLKEWDDLEHKLVALAQAVPQEKYTWRPGEGVRSFSEVFLHMAGANFGFLAMLGVQPPAGIDRQTYEKSTTDRAKIVENLKQSFDHVRQFVLKTSDADLEKPAKLFGRETTVRGVLYVLGTHQPEHLGQLIAYSRVNGLVPPWTAERQAQQQQKPKQ